MVRLARSLLLAAMLVAVVVCNAADRFHTLKVSNPDDFMAPPVIWLGGDDRISINFDELGDGYSELRYRLVHCNADWSPSAMQESEYLDGFNEKDIEDYAFSSNTFTHYVNYQLTLPAEGMRPLISGNYLVEIYDREDPDKVIVKVPFMVAEETARISGTVSGRTDRGMNTEWQQLSIRVDLSDDSFREPVGNVILSVSQNGRRLTRRDIRVPSRREGNTLIYEHIDQLIFPASNEYRRFENVSTAAEGMNTDSLRYIGDGYHVWLKPDYPRADSPYTYDSTQRGRFMVRESNSTDSNLGADYITAHFTLRMPRLPGSEIYVDGEFTGGRYDETNRMAYDRSRGEYTLSLPLKQGAYNYQYVVKSGEDGMPSTAAIEGNKYETVNEYDVAVYYRGPGDRCDRLIGFRQLVNQF